MALAIWDISITVNKETTGHGNWFLCFALQSQVYTNCMILKTDITMKPDETRSATPVYFCSSLSTVKECSEAIQTETLILQILCGDLVHLAAV